MPGQFNAFCHITDTFIKAGSREEVNIRYAEKKLVFVLFAYQCGQLP